ncbi:Universal stress protein [Rhodococcus sp. B7740]|nr:Universal stress protein [Rhodococcus sp. B7740]
MDAENDDMTYAHTAPTVDSTPKVNEHASTIAVGIDGSDGSIGALAWAAGIARTTGSKLHIVHALGVHGLGVHGLGVSRSEGRRLLRAAAHTVDRIAPDVGVDTVLTDQTIAQYLHHRSSAVIDLAVIGVRSSTPTKDALFGHNATRIVAGIRCPIVVWRPYPFTIRCSSPIVVGVDESESSIHALALAFWFAETWGSPVHALHLSSHSSLDWLRARTGEVAARHPHVDLHLHCLGTSTAEQLRRESVDARLVVVGSHGCGLAVGAVRGSTVQRLVRSARGPLLVVP